MGQICRLYTSGLGHICHRWEWLFIASLVCSERDIVSPVYPTQWTRPYFPNFFNYFIFDNSVDQTCFCRSLGESQCTSNFILHFSEKRIMKWRVFTKSNILPLPGLEPGSLAWKSSLLTTRPHTHRLFQWLTKAFKHSPVCPQAWHVICIDIPVIIQYTSRDVKP